MAATGKIALFAAVAIIAASPAFAGWQFTTWGMTPAQVMTASQGAAALVDPTDRSSLNGDRVLLEMLYVTGDFDFAASFAFDSAGHLDRVHLVLRSGSAIDLRAALIAKYGKPKDQDPDVEAFGGRAIWIAPDEQIVLSQMGSNAPGVTPNVSMDYIRLGTASGSGL